VSSSRWAECSSALESLALAGRLLPIPRRPLAFGGRPRAIGGGLGAQLLQLLEQGRIRVGIANQLRGERVEASMRQVTAIRDSIPPRRTLIALAGCAHPLESAPEAPRAACGPCGSGRGVGSIFRRRLDRCRGVIAVGGRLVAIRGALVFIGACLVGRRGRLVGVRRRLIGVRGGLIGIQREQHVDARPPSRIVQIMDGPQSTTVAIFALDWAPRANAG
jgi:hypothetical protein